ncbi:STM4504/CBY_0614 family protein [Acidicapsa acidisoli]|uniref:STM4504/CBY_0614 family protein n=1 Tax=Acidicapsa acidisoli TaxID=1615681 RepID=UPI0021DF6F0E|nr:hypothetical protein [Acidicapsa acidisoli]
MGIKEKFSLRQRKLKGQVSDVFIYDHLPRALRSQICHILARCLGAEQRDYVGKNRAYRELRQKMAEELGVFNIGNPLRGDDAAIMEFFRDDATDEEALDLIETAFNYALERNGDWQWRQAFCVTVSMDEAINDLNRRFLEHQVGYTFLGGETPQLIKRDNDHLHQEAILPALRLLHEEGFEGANDEYRKAHEHYRQGNQKECLSECLKAFESTLKTICNRRKWECKPTDTAKPLIDICVDNGLFPSFMESHLGAIKGALATAIPTIRNKMGGHGQGELAVSVPQFYAEYLLHETAATIVFLVDAYKAMG